LQEAAPFVWKDADTPTIDALYPCFLLAAIVFILPWGASLLFYEKDPFFASWS
jgi:hypothetical protein